MSTFTTNLWIKYQRTNVRSSRPGEFCKKGVLKNFAKLYRKTPVSEFFLSSELQTECNFIKKETPIQVFSCEFCEIFKKPSL